jgi:capsular polysaccharide biosynthesis protein
MDPQQPPTPDPSNEPPFIDITPEPSGNGSLGSGQYPHSHLDRMLRRRRFVFFGSLFLLTLATALWLWTRPQQYEATASVLLTRIGPDATPVSEGEMASEIQLIWAQTQRLADLERGVGSVGESSQTAENRRTQIRSHIGVKQQANSQSIAISYTSPSASIAVEQANRLTELYLLHRQSLFRYPRHLTSMEAETLVLQSQADQASKDLADFDLAAGKSANPESFRIKTQRLANLEDRILELRASIRGQEEVLRVLRKQQSPEAPQSEAELAGMRAKLQETQKEFARLESLETQAGTLAAKRNELSRRATLARERAEAIERRLRESQIIGMNLQAIGLTSAEVAAVSSVSLEWWQILGIALGVLAIASLLAWFIEVFDKPVYSDDEFARMTGAAKIRTNPAM